MIPPRILLAGLACLCPFTLAQKLKSDPHKTLIIISTSDMHGNLEKFPKLATLVKQYRAKYPHVLLVDSGDYFMGNPYVDDWEKRGEPLTVLMNKLKYDIVTIGNHDLDYGQEALRDHIKGMPGTKFVVTNVNPSPTLENCFSPYASIPIKGTPISIGFIGLVDLQTTDVRRMSGISWKLPDEEDYKGITDRFRLHHNTINVILSHLGYDHDLKMMKYSPNIDVILGGHTHVMLPHGHLRTGTLLSHTGHRLSHAGVTEITFSTEKPASILSKSTKAVSLDERIPSDPEVEKNAAQPHGPQTEPCRRYGNHLLHGKTRLHPFQVHEGRFPGRKDSQRPGSREDCPAVHRKPVFQPAGGRRRGGYHARHRRHLFLQSHPAGLPFGHCHLQPRRRTGQKPSLQGPHQDQGYL